MMKESVKMYEFEHPHVLSIIGVCVDSGPAPYIVMPFMANGSLLTFIKKEKMNLVVPIDSDDNQLASVWQRQREPMYFQVAYMQLVWINVKTLLKDLIPLSNSGNFHSQSASWRQWTYQKG